jgi:hypothetical protein
MSFIIDKMLVIASTSESIVVERFAECLSIDFHADWLLVLLLISHDLLDVIRCLDCPLLQSHREQTGLLIVNKTAMLQTGLPMHCQWLIASSRGQVS